MLASWIIFARRIVGSIPRVTSHKGQKRSSAMYAYPDDATSRMRTEAAAAAAIMRSRADIVGVEPRSLRSAGPQDDDLRRRCSSEALTATHAPPSHVTLLGPMPASMVRCLLPCDPGGSFG